MPYLHRFVLFRFIFQGDAMRLTLRRDRGGKSHRRNAARDDRHLTITAAGLACLFVLVWAAPSVAADSADCNGDIGKMMAKRQDIIAKLNKLVGSTPKHQLDPTTSCGPLRELAATERVLSAYLTKNKEWCQVPDSAVTSIQTSSKHTAAIADNACRVAEQIKKSQDAIGTGPKLPSGPL